MMAESGMRIHMIGIGGIGMSALAQLYQHQGHQVSGTDRSPSDKVRSMLAGKGVAVSTQHGTVPEGADLVVYSDAVVEGSEGYPELAVARRRGIKTQSYFEALGEASRAYRVVAVAGTHGKTTTTGMVGKILIDAGKSPTIVVGSIVADFGSNFVAGTSDILVVEADEYREHFLNFSPEVLIINNLEHDHTDYYPTFADLARAFTALSNQVKEGGTIVTNPKVPAIAAALAGSERAIVDYEREEVPELRLIGGFNRQNARAAKAAAQAICPDLTDEMIDRSLAEFAGSWRRFEYKGKSAAGAVIYDDYAHHPTAVKETLKGARERFPEARIIAAFHPHLYSRTRDLLDDFARAFGDADLAFIAPIYAAREVDDGTVSSAMLAERIRRNGIEALAFDSLESVRARLTAELRAGDLLITMGAGDIYLVAEALAAGNPA